MGRPKCAHAVPTTVASKHGKPRLNCSDTRETVAVAEGIEPYSEMLITGLLVS